MMERLYRHFAKLFSGEITASRLFDELGNEEKSHADLLRYQLRIVKDNLNIFHDVAYDAVPLADLMNQIKSIVKADQPPTLREALSFSMAAERSACEVHYRTVIGESNHDMGELIRNLGAYDEAHQQRLGAFAMELGIHDSTPADGILSEYREKTYEQTAESKK